MFGVPELEVGDDFFRDTREPGSLDLGVLVIPIISMEHRHRWPSGISKLLHKVYSRQIRYPLAAFTLRWPGVDVSRWK